MASIKTNSTYMLISKLSKTVLDVVAVMLLARALSVQEYGFYKQFLVSQQILTAVMSLGIPSSTIFYLSSERKREYLANVYIALGIISILTILITPLSAKLFDLNFKTSFFTTNWLELAIIYALSVFVTASENMLIALDKLKYMPIYVLLPSAFWTVGIAFSLIFETNINFVLMIFLIRYLLYFILTVVFAHEKFDFKQLRRNRMKEILLFGLPVGVSSMIGLFSSNISKLVIGNLYDTETFAIFSNGAYEIPLLSIIGSSLFSVIIPQLKNHFDMKRLDEVNRLWNKAGLSMIPIIVSLASSFIIFSEPIVLFLFSEKYVKSVPYFTLYQIGLFFRIYSYGSLFIATGKSKLYMINAAISMVLNLVLDIILAILIGPIGAIIAGLISTFVLVILQLYQISMILNMSILKIYPWKEWMLSIGLSLLISMGFYIAYRFFSTSMYLGLGFAVVSFGISFLVLSRFVDNQVLEYALSIVKRKTKARAK